MCLLPPSGHLLPLNRKHNLLYSVRAPLFNRRSHGSLSPSPSACVSVLLVLFLKNILTDWFKRVCFLLYTSWLCLTLYLNARCLYFTWVFSREATLYIYSTSSWFQLSTLLQLVTTTDTVLAYDVNTVDFFNNIRTVCKNCSTDQNQLACICLYVQVYEQVQHWLNATHSHLSPVWEGCILAALHFRYRCLSTAFIGSVFCLPHTVAVHLHTRCGHMSSATFQREIMYFQLLHYIQFKLSKMYTFY